MERGGGGTWRTAHRPRAGEVSAKGISERIDGGSPFGAVSVRLTLWSVKPIGASRRHHGSVRESIVLELFAHDREDLAWRAAEAPAALISDIVERETDAMRRGEPTRSSLALAAIATLEGARPATPPPRSRSPVLEMPAELRHRAHRNAVRDALTVALRHVRRTKHGWGWLVVEAWQTPSFEKTPFYVQFSSYPGPGIRAEAVGNVHLPPKDRLDAHADLRMRSLGWEPGTAAGSDGNWTRMLGTVSREDRSALAEFAIATLEDGFGCGPGIQFRVVADSWSIDSVPPIEAQTEADGSPDELLPGARVLPPPADDEALLTLARDWVQLLAQDRFEEALAMLSLPADEEDRHGFAPDTLREWIANYGSWDPWRDGTAWRVTSMASATVPADRPAFVPTAKVMRFDADPRSGVIELDVPLNGAWSDLTARFGFGPAGDGIGLVLQDIRVL